MSGGAHSIDPIQVIRQPIYPVWTRRKEEKPVLEV